MSAGRVLGAPPALDQHQLATGSQHPDPAAERGAGIGQRPQQMPAQHHVEPLPVDRRVGSVTEQHCRGAAGQLAPGVFDHVGGEVDAGHVVPLRGEYLCQ
jgi:hypothetical protein